MLSDKQRAILAFPHTKKYTALICDGAVRSGKTSLMMVAFIDWAMQNFDRQRFGICGKTVDSTVKNIIIPYLSMTRSQEIYSLQWRRADKLLMVSDGRHENAFEVFGGKDESSFALIQGRTLAGVLLDEVVLMPESFVNQALARCSVDGARFWFSCNPAGPTHWFKENWIDKARERGALYLHFTLDDNPGLSEETIQRYKTMYTGVFYQRYILGEWVRAEGLVYPMFSRDTHVVPSESVGGGRYYISIDYGTLNPFAMGLWCLMRDGTAAMVKEYYHDGRKSQRQKTDAEYYDTLVAFAEGHRIERIIVDPSAASFIELIHRNGDFGVWKAKNAVLDGIRQTGTLLQQRRLLFTPDCVNTMKEFGEYSWDGDSVGQDAVIKENDHSMDQMRYFVMTVMRRG